MKNFNVLKQILYAGIVLGQFFVCGNRAPVQDSQTHHQKQQNENRGELQERHDHNNESPQDHHHHDHHDQHSDKRHEIRALKNIDRRKGFQLNTAAVQALKIQTKALSDLRITGNSKFKHIYRVPKSAVMFTGNRVAIFSYYQQWYRMWPVIILNKQQEQIVIRTERKIFGELVIGGVGLLRMAHIEAFEAHSIGHGHSH